MNLELSSLKWKDLALGAKWKGWPPLQPSHLPLCTYRLCYFKEVLRLPFFLAIYSSLNIRGSCGNVVFNHVQGISIDVVMSLIKRSIRMPRPPIYLTC